MSNKKGHLIIVGAGISAVTQLTAEVSREIETADIVFYHATTRIMAEHIIKLNQHSVDLYQYYGENKIRRKTYVQMAEVMLREVRNGRRVVGVFHGHPSFFVMATRRAWLIARGEGHTAKLLPGVSSIDCMLADLCIDPGVFGLQIVKAGAYLRGKVKLSTSCHVAFLQISSVGDETYSYSGYKNTKIASFFEKLSGEYGGDQEVIFYSASLLTDGNPLIEKKLICECDAPYTFHVMGSRILYVPPIGLSYEAMLERQAFGVEEAYGPFAEKAIQEL